MITQTIIEINYLLHVRIIFDAELIYPVKDQDTQSAVRVYRSKINGYFHSRIKV